MSKIGGIVITILMVGLLLGIGFLVITNFQSDLSTITNYVYNETITPTGQGAYVAYNSTTDGVICYKDFTIISISAVNYTDTSQWSVDTGNYSAQSNVGYVYNLTGDALADEWPDQWNVTYTYMTGGDACEGIDTTISSLSSLPTWIGTLLLVVMIGIILFVLFKVMGGVGMKSSGTTAEI